jgi:hypothetical protein
MYSTHLANPRSSRPANRAAPCKQEPQPPPPPSRPPPAGARSGVTARKPASRSRTTGSSHAGEVASVWNEPFQPLSQNTRINHSPGTLFPSTIETLLPNARMDRIQPKPGQFSPFFPLLLAFWATEKARFDPFFHSSTESIEKGFLAPKVTATGTFFRHSQKTVLRQKR